MAFQEAKHIRRFHGHTRSYDKSIKGQHISRTPPEIGFESRFSQKDTNRWIKLQNLIALAFGDHEPRRTASGLDRRPIQQNEAGGLEQPFFTLWNSLPGLGNVFHLRGRSRTSWCP